MLGMSQARRLRLNARWLSLQRVIRNRVLPVHEGYSLAEPDSLYSQLSIVDGKMFTLTANTVVLRSAM